MEATRLQRLAALADAYPELREVLALDRQQVKEDLLRRASVAPSFDERLYQELTAGLDNPPSFLEFTEMAEVERIPYSEGSYWVRDSVRATYIGPFASQEASGWSSEDVRAWSSRLAPFFNNPSDALKLLELRALFDPDGALDQFERLYRQADDRCDLARCYALIGALRSRQSSLNVELHNAYQDYLRLYSSRAMFAEEYHQTVGYFQREGMGHLLRDLLREKDGKWILHIYGGGGMGKTMMARWLISHRLVRRQMRVPCVRIDLDAFSLSAVTDSPWLLALPIAEQLQDQVDVSTFKTIARDLASYRALLLTGQRPMTTEGSHLLAASASEVDYLPKIQDAFRHLERDKPVVLFLDTIEEATLHRPEKVMNVLAFFSALRVAAPNLRLMIAGRYQLGREHIPEFAFKYDAVTNPVEVARLNDNESRAFFSLQVPKAEEAVVNAALARGEGNPFKLSLLGELIRENPEITDVKLLGKEFEDVEVAYLIQRVVSRIPISKVPEESHLPVRWVIRYGAIARRLTADFIEHVLAPPLQQALRGETQEIGDDMVDEAISMKVWTTDPSFSIDTGTIWRRLTEYASNHGWISIDKHDANTARFHPDVVVPMRRLLSKQKIYARLQEAALRYFRGRNATVDVLYHQMQLHPESIVADWTTELDVVAGRSSAPERRSIVEGLLGSDFADAGDRAKAVAHFHAAEAIAGESGWGTLLLPSGEFDSAQSHLNAARQLQGEPEVVPASVWICLAAADRFRFEPEQALSDLDSALADAKGTSDRVRLLMHVGEMKAQLGRGGQEQMLEALRLLPEGGSHLLHERIAELNERDGAWLDAYRHYGDALKSAVKLGLSGTIRRLRRRVIRLNIVLGHFGEAFRMLFEAEGIPFGREPQDPEWFDLHAEVALAAKRPATAIDFASSILQSASGMTVPEAHFYRAKAYEMQLLLSQATHEYQQASAAYNELGDLAGLDECTMAELLLHILYSGNLRAAEGLLGRQVHTRNTNPYYRAMLAFAQAMVTERQGHRDLARTALSRALGNANWGRERAMILLGGLALNLWEDHELGARTLINAVEKIQPESSRLSLLELLVVSPRWAPLPPDVRSRLDELFVYKPQDKLEAPVHALLKAELLRVIGEPEGALGLLDRVIPSFEGSSFDSQFAYMQRLQTEYRLRRGGAKFTTHVAPALLEACARFPLLSVSARLSYTAAMLDAGAVDQAKEILAPAPALLRQEGIDTIYEAQYIDLTAAMNLGAEGPGSPLQALPGVNLKLGYTSPGPAAPPPGSGGFAEAADFDEFEDLKCSLFSLACNTDANVFMTFEPPMYFKPVAPSQYPGLPMVYEQAQQRMPTMLYRAFANDWVRMIEYLSALFHLRERPVKGKRMLLDTSSSLAGIPWEFSPVFREPGLIFRAPIRMPVLTSLGNLESGGVAVGAWNAVTRALRAISGNRDLTAAREALRQTPRTEPPRVMVVAPQTSVRRSEADYAYTRIYERYSSIGLQVRSAANVDSLDRLVADWQPDAMIIVSEMIDSPSIPEPMLATGRMLARTVSHIAGLVRKGIPGPTVILDTPLPSTPEDSIQQIHARNRFASELQRAGNVTAVIGTGLGSAEDVRVIHSQLAALLAEDASLDETLDAIRDGYKGSRSLRDALPYLGFAVFSSHPHQLLAPRETPSHD